MSGSGGGSGSRDITTPCNNLKFKTDIASPKPAALSLDIGDELEIILYGEGVAVMHNGQLVGGIACKETSRLAHCLSLGNIYFGSVLDKNLGRIGISIFPG